MSSSAVRPGIAGHCTGRGRSEGRRLARTEVYIRSGIDRWIRGAIDYDSIGYRRRTEIRAVIIAQVYYKVMGSYISLSRCPADSEQWL